MSKDKLKIWFAPLFGLVLLFFVLKLVTNDKQNEIYNEQDAAHSNKQEDIVGHETIKDAEDDGDFVDDGDNLIEWEVEIQNDPETQRLTAFLDENDEESILSQSEFLVCSESPIRRYAVIGALEWIGSPKAGVLLSCLLKDENSEISEYAQSALSNIFDKLIGSITMDDETEEFFSEYDVNDIYDMCVTSILNASNEDNADELMLKVDALDPKIALPILLEVLESGNGRWKDLILEHLDRDTYGSGVTNREEAMRWLIEEEK